MRPRVPLQKILASEEFQILLIIASRCCPGLEGGKYTGAQNIVRLISRRDLEPAILAQHVRFNLRHGDVDALEHISTRV